MKLFCDGLHQWRHNIKEADKLISQLITIHFHYSIITNNETNNGKEEIQITDLQKKNQSNFLIEIEKQSPEIRKK